MQIKNIELENFRGIKKQKINLLPNINVFVGVNGSGKSTILDAIAISLSWLVEGIEKIESQGDNIPDDSIKNGTDYASIKLEISQENTTYKWENIEVKRGYPADKSSNLLQLNQLVFEIQKAYKNDHQLPMIAYYPINRIDNVLSQKSSFSKSFSQLDVYDNALGSQANFQSFFEWFRLQDDIINEHTTSRRKWMREHKQWIFFKLKKALSYLKSDENSKIDQFIKRISDKDEFLLEEPRFLFHELMKIIEYIDNDKSNRNLYDIDYLLLRMSRLLDRDEETDFILKEIGHFYREFYDEKPNFSNMNKNENFIWAMFLFSIQLSFWRLSQKGRDNIEKHLNNSKSKKNINIENFISVIQNIVLDDSKRLEHALVHQDRELEIVTKAIESFIPEYQNLRITRIPTPRMLIEKNGETLSLNQLSGGEKNMIAMIGDIARRLTMANPRLPNPLEGDGIVMIDEIDLHLHPAWQRVIISKLTEVFPNCQFIVSTHSPHILSSTYYKNIIMLQDGEAKQLSKPLRDNDINHIVELIMGVSPLPIELDKNHKIYRELVENGKENTEEAKDIKNKILEYEGIGSSFFRRIEFYKKMNKK